MTRRTSIKKKEREPQEKPPYLSRSFHLQRHHDDALTRRSRCGRTPSKTFSVVFDRYVHLMSVGRERLAAKGVSDVVIQSLAELLRWQQLNEILVTVRLPETLREMGVSDEVAAKLATLDDLEAIALADAVEMMFDRYRAKL